MFAPVLACAAPITAVVLYPLVRFLIQAVMAWDWETLQGEGGLTPLWNTLFVSAASVAGAGVFGTTLAFFFSRLSFPGRAFLAALAYLPFALPPLVGVLAFFYLIGRDGVLSLFFEQAFGVTGFHPSGPVAILLIHAYSFSVFFYAMVSAALEGQDRTLLEAARTLGATPWRCLTRVTLPGLAPALRGAALLTFMCSCASFSAPLLFGEGFPMLTARIYEANTQFDKGAALTLTTVLMLLALTGIPLFRGPASRPAASGAKGAPARFRPRRGRWMITLLGAAIAALLLLPHLAIIWLSLVDHSRWFNEAIPTVFTLSNYQRLFAEPETLAPIRNSLWMAGTAAMAVLLFAIPAGYLLGRRRPGHRFINILVMLPWALPGTVVAMNLLSAFNDPWLPLDLMAWMLPVAYFIRGVPLLTRVAAAAMEPFDARLMEAGRTLGATPWRCVTRIALPLLGPPLMAGAALVFATSLGEFVASILLYQPDNMPIAVMINMQLRGSEIGCAFAYSVLLLAAVTVTFLIMRRVSARFL